MSKVPKVKTKSDKHSKGSSSSGKNTKESFQNKLLICSKQFVYKDESKDVKGKTERLNAISEI